MGFAERMRLCHGMRFGQLNSIGGWNRAGLVAGDQQDPDRRRDRTAARIIEMPHRPRGRRPCRHFFAGVPHRQLDLRVGRAQVHRFAADLAIDVQGSARHGADRRVQLRQPAALYGNGAEQGGHGGYADGRFAGKHRGSLAVGLSAVADALTERARVERLLLM